ncbi:MAG: DUF2834 domain-containing protein [Deltaproteobacteria bacterium]|nr:DUF2834 domain-containing protein [Deltaproteobacteria bacterium]
MFVPRWLLALLSLGFFGISTVAVGEFGYVGLWRLIGQDAGTVQLFADLCVAMTLVTTWLRRDARRRGEPAWPWLLLTVLGGSAGPLGYLGWRALRDGRSGSAGADASSPPA